MGRIDELIRQLESGDPNERYQAASALGELGDPKALPALLQALDDEDPNVHIAAARAVGKTGDLNAIQNLLDAYERRTVQFAEPIFDAIGEILGRTDPDDEKSREVFSRVVDRLVGIVQKDNTPIDLFHASQAAEALGKTRDPKAIPVLTEKLREGKHEEIARTAARALRYFDDSQATQALIQAATNKNLSVDAQVAAMQSLADIGKPEFVDPLIRILEDRPAGHTIRSAAARALGRIGDPKAIESLIRILETEKDDSYSPSQAIAEALGAFRDPRVIDALIGALVLHRYIAHAAAKSLKKLRDPRAVEPLIKLVDPSDDKANYSEQERALAAQILGVLGDPRAIPALVNALHDHDADIRKAASQSLLAFVPTHPDAILRLPPDDRHRLGRQIQDSEREELLQEVCK